MLLLICSVPAVCALCFNSNPSQPCLTCLLGCANTYVYCTLMHAGLILSRANLVFRRNGRTVRARNAHLPVISAKVGLAGAPWVQPGCSGLLAGTPGVLSDSAISRMLAFKCLAILSKPLDPAA